MPVRRKRKQPRTGHLAAAAEELIPDTLDNEYKKDSEPAVTAVYLSPDHQYLAVVTDYINLAVYRLDGERLGEKLVSHDANKFARIKWSKASTTLAFVSYDFQATVLDIAHGVFTELGPATGVAFSPDDTTLAALGDEGLDIWHIASRRVVRNISFQDAPDADHLTRVEFEISPDGRWMVFAAGSRAFYVLDAESLTQIGAAPDGMTPVHDLAWLGPDTLATASVDGTIRIWRLPELRELRVLEAERAVSGIAYSAALDCLMGWTHREYFAWSATNWDIIVRREVPVSMASGYRLISASPRSDLLVRLDGPNVADIVFSHGLDARSDQALRSVSTYANAKILIVGDSGVGKSGLAMVLAGEPFRPTESTHARRIWKMPLPELAPGLGAQREVLLWDLAGQPGYRIVHQLHLGEGAVVLILFDSRSEIMPLAGIGYWARALRHARASRGDPMPTFLVGARTDRGVVGVSDERLAEVVAEFGFTDCLATSAKEGWGVGELRAAVLSAIDWDQMPVVTSSALFAAAKSFVLSQKEAGTLLTPLASLLAAFLIAPVSGPAAAATPHSQTGRDLLDAEPGGEDQTRLRAVFEGCVARLESAGLVKRLAFGDLVMLQPELIDVYAGAIVNAAREEPDGLGSMLESRVLDVDFRLPEQERIADGQQEKLLIIATLEELTRHEIVLREVTEDGVQLVFPAAFRRDLPDAAEPHDNTVEFTFEGPVVNIYVTLVVRLARSDRFTRRGTFQSAAQFEADAGGVCTVHLTRSDEGRGALQVGYSGEVADVVRFQFERFVLTHLERRASPGSLRRVRLYRCPDCGSPFSSRQVEAAVSRSRTSLLCPVDETRVPLEDSYETLSRAQDAVAREMDASADAARGIAAASSVILGKEETTDFDVFLCHNADDKPAVRLIAQRLREHGILPWLDENELRPGRDWQEELERQITNIRTAAVFVGPSGIGPWQNRELRAFLNEFAERGCPVIPVLLPQAAAPTLPVFLRGLTWVDLRAGDDNGIRRLMWGVTGRKPDPSGSDEVLE